MTVIKDMMYFGDSLTWGWTPRDYAVLTERFPSAERWTGVLANERGVDSLVIEEGLSGRATSGDRPPAPPVAIGRTGLLTRMSMLERLARRMAAEPQTIIRTLALHWRRRRDGCCDCCSGGGQPVLYPCIPARTAMRAHEIELALSAGGSPART